MKLFHHPGAVSLASYIALEEAGAEFEPVRLDLRAGEQRSEDYLKLNPKGRVPTLVTDEGVLTETPAILTYVAARYPEAGLAPADPFDFARMQSVMSYLAATVHVAYAHLRRGYRWADDDAAVAEMRRKGPEVITASLQVLDQAIGQGPWALGDQFTVADAHVMVMTWWAELDGISLANLPNLRGHLDRMQARPAVKRVFEREGLKPS